MRFLSTRSAQTIAAMTLIAGGTIAQPCLIDYDFTANPPPVGGQYNGGQNVQFCFTINDWDQAGINWLHGVVPSFGAGWDLTTLVPGAPPPECGFGGGTWVWANSVTGTSLFSVGPTGPGYFFDLDNDGNPGNNLGDDCSGPWTFCFTISVASGFNCVNGADLTVTMDTFGDSETGSWDTPGCGGDVMPMQIATAFCCAANAGTDGFTSVCFSDPAFDLFALLGNAPDPGGTWTDPFGVPTNPLLDPQVSSSGDYTYTVSTPGCTPDDAVVTVVINFPANAGFDAMASVCDQGAPEDLYPYLGGADPGGTWSDPFGGFSNGFFDPAFDIPGVYTYTLPALGNCPGDDATVTVNVVPGPNAGVSNAIDVCSNTGVIDLFPILGGADPGGTWTGPGGGFNNGFFDTFFDAPGTYTYVIFPNAPCQMVMASIDVTVNFPPQGGVSVPVSFCSADPITDLLPLFNGLVDPGGSWTDPNGIAFSGMLNPSTATPGTYTYTVAGIAPCPDGVNTMDVTINPSPDPGLPGGLTICAQGDPVDLLPALLGTPDAGGTWTNPNGAATPGLIDPSVALAGTYTYTVPANGICPGGSSTVDLVVVAPPDAGTDNSVSACENDPNIFLSQLLGGSQNPNGSWTGPGGGASNGIVDPTLLDAGDYLYSVPGVPPCPNDIATITVVIDTLPDPGQDATVAICENLVGVDLFTLLGQADAVGTWTAPDGSPYSGLFDPATDATGDYTYTVVGQGACTGQVLTAVVTATSLGLPSPLFVQDTTQGCIPLTISFGLNDPTITSSAWTFGDGATIGGILDAMHTYDEPGLYDVSVSVLDANGCTDTLSIAGAVLAHGLPDPFFISEPNPAGTLTPDFAFTTAVTDYPSYVWTADGDSVGSGIPFSIHFPYFEARTTEMCLIVTDTNQCSAEHCEDVVVDQDLAVYVPNAFSPNGNGINEFFYPVILDAASTDYEFTIFDRWGELVFTTTDRTEAWNGGMDNAETPLEPGVFTWRLRLRESSKAEREEIYGHVTLLK